MTRKRKYVPDLVSDMAECDANYIRLQRLFSSMDSEESREFGVEGVTEDGARVSLHITERCRYTTMMTMRVENEADKPWVRWPLLTIRVYHDT